MERLINLQEYQKIVFFTGAGMSAESGVPTYRGKGGLWREYRWEEYACQRAFLRDPENVLRFHEERRQAVFECHPHAGHRLIAGLNDCVVVTQNIDGMHQRAGSREVVELHGSLWRVRCSACGFKKEQITPHYESYQCGCGNWLRPDIVWFEDMLDETVVHQAMNHLSRCDLLISIGTSGSVWPAAGFPSLAKENGAYCIEINPEPSGGTLFDYVLVEPACSGLERLFGFSGNIRTGGG
jgi:NAD-dependent deacetylase